MQDNYILFSSGARNEASGVAILLHAKYCRDVKYVQRLSHRVMSIDTRFNGLNFRLIAAYLPHAGYDEESLSEGYDQIQMLVDDASSKNMKIVIGGDFHVELSEDSSRGEMLKQ